MDAGYRSAAPNQPPGEHAADTMLYHSERTRVFRRRQSDGTSIVCKEPLGPKAAERLRHERRILERLQGIDGVPRLIPHRTAPGMLVVEDGANVPLAQLAREKAMSGPDLLSIALQLTLTLAAVHRAGVIHKDINPSNILLRAVDRRPVLIDYDLATTFAEERPGFIPAAEIAGTLAYLAPEQTGRTGRPVDQRADLYALGATLYELAAGRPPFDASDPFQVIQDHLARVPDAPIRRGASIPQGLSEIILRLLEKEPDDRYQSAEGLAHDLASLRERLARGEQSAFPLCTRDFPLRLKPPSRLVGRAAEIDALRSSFDKALRSGASLMVLGAPGVGKSALIDELRPMTGARGGWFVSGKFDQYRQNLAATGLTQAMRALGRLLLAEPEAEVATYRKRILGAMGNNAGILRMPEFKALLGVGDEPMQDDERDAANRLRQAGIDMLRAVAAPERPLVLVLDDLQWADPGTFAFLDALVTADDLRGLLLVAAYRESEVDATHPLTALLQRWQRLGVAPPQLRLANLPTEDLAEMLAEMLRIAPESALRLAGAVGERSAGNPYDTVELINALRREGVLQPNEQGWSWDEAEIRRHVGAGDVVDLVAVRLARLCPDSRELVDRAACLGGAVPLALLQAATGRAASELEILLEPAFEDGLLMMDQDAGTLCFRHDRVQQVAYERMDAQQRDALRLSIARRLASTAEFESIAAEQYLSAIDAVTDERELRDALALFHRAATAARGITVSLGAERYLGAARELLRRLGDAEDSALAIELAIDHHAVLYALGRFEEADRIFMVIERHCDDRLKLTAATRVQVCSLTDRGRSRDALELGFAMLGRLGLPIPEVDIEPELELRMNEFHRWAHEDISRGDDRPEVTDPLLISAGSLLCAMAPPANHCDMRLFAWLILETQRLWVAHGPCPAFAVSLNGAPFMTMALHDDYRTGYAVSRHVVSIVEARDWRHISALIRFGFYAVAAHWFEPFEQCAEQVQAARDDLLREGHVQMAGFTYNTSMPILLECAPTLAAAFADVEAGCNLAIHSGSQYASGLFENYRTFVRRMRDDQDAPDQAPEEADAGDRHPTANVVFHIYQALVAAVFNDGAGLLRHATAAIPLLPYTMAVPPYAVAHLLHALALAQQAAAARDAEQRDRSLAEMATSCAWLAQRAQEAPGNFLHLQRWLEAERIAAGGDVLDALAAFDAALNEARSRPRPWHRALIAERAARFHLARRFEHSGRELLAMARRHYDAWGAHAKVRQLEREYPFLRALAVHSPANNAASSSGITRDSIDLLGVLRTSQALSSETHLARLTLRVVRVLRDMTGATEVHLVLRDDDSQTWQLAPAAEGDAPLPIDEIENAGLLPLSAFRFTERTREPLLVEDALRDGRFARDPRFARVERCSLLAVPILNHGVLRAILILENSLSRGAFTVDRLDAVTLVTGQLAVSLENALLYASLERKVEQRTEDLKAANLRLEALSSTDPLTGLANRRRFNEAIEAEWQRAQRPQSPVALAMIDVDFFKLYNDHYGHLDGDECLRRVAQALNESVRVGTDLVARYGGEEFVILLPGTTLEAAHTVAERARAAVEAARLPHAKSTSGFVSVSIGIAAVVPSAAARSEQLTALADSALYEAKRTGRNRIAVGTPGDGAVTVPAPKQGPALPQPVVRAVEPAAIAPSPKTPLRILLIEDSEADALLITRELKRGLKDASVERVETADALDAALEREEWDMVVCDYHLPSLGALPALARVRRLARYLPFVIVSGAIREDAAVEAMKLGADDYVMKDNLARLVPAVQREIEAAALRGRQTQAEQALRDSLDLYRSLADALPMGLYRIDRAGGILFLNDFMIDVAGLRNQDYLGRSIYALSDDLPAMRHAIEEDRLVIETGKASTRVQQFDAAGGEAGRAWEITRVPVRDAGGAIVGLQGVIRDVTEALRNEEQLAFERDLLRNLMDNIPDIIYFKDPELRYIRINKALADRYRLNSPNEAIGKRGNDFLDSRSAQRGERDERDILRTGVPRLAVEDHLALPDGRVRWFLRTEVPIRNAKGEISGLVAVSRDITARKAVEHKLAESEELFRQISENIRDAFYLVDLNTGKFLYVSPTYEEIWGRSRESLISAPDSWVETIHPDDRERVMSVYFAQRGTHFDDQFRIVRPDGTVRWIHSRGYPVADSQGVPYRFVAVTADITQQKEQERHIQQLSRVQAVLSGINALIVRATDRARMLREACHVAVQAGRFVSAHIALVVDDMRDLRLTASSETDPGRLERLQNALTLSVTDPVMRDFRDQVLARCEARVIGNIMRDLPEAMRPNAAQLGARSLATLPLVVADRTIGIFVLYAREPEFFDAEEMKLLAELAGDIAFALDHLDKTEKLDYLAYYDQLTGLANSHLFRERLDQEIRGAQTRNGRVAVALLDVEHFKTFNDALGRPTGDELLKQVGQRLVAYSGSNATVARLGADHFALLLPDAPDADQVAHIVVQHYTASFAEPFPIGGREFKVAASLGIAMHPDDGAEVDTLFRNAEAALKKAKLRGERYLFYTQEMTERVAERLTLENKLRRAVDNEEFVLHYQPKVHSGSRRIAGVEALIRWNDPESGMMPPMDFVPILEGTGLILEAGAWALRRAAQDHAEWRARGLDAPRIAVNVSAIQLRQGDFVDMVGRAIAIGGFAPGIDLEITESLIMQDIEDTINKLKAIRDMGVQIAIDDFGTGYSSLAYLSRLPVSTVKIDRSFIITMLHDQNTMTMVSTIISLAHSLGLRVVAEGVDEEAQADVLRRLGCDEMQGYLYRKPMPAADILRLIRED